MVLVDEGWEGFSCLCSRKWSEFEGNLDMDDGSVWILPCGHPDYIGSCTVTSNSGSGYRIQDCDFALCGWISDKCWKSRICQWGLRKVVNNTHIRVSCELPSTSTITYMYIYTYTIQRSFCLLIRSSHQWVHNRWEGKGLIVPPCYTCRILIGFFLASPDILLPMIRYPVHWVFSCCLFSK